MVKYNQLPKDIRNLQERKERINVLTMQTKTKTALWVSAVYLFSFLCYTPMLLKRFGYIFPEALSYLKYGFVFVPAIISVLFLIREHKLSKYLVDNFKKISLKEIVPCIIIALVGISITCCYSLVEKVSLFNNTYSSLASLVFSCIYLYVTALIEEMAWRGFFFQCVITEKKIIISALFVGIVWAAWHIPMWTIRNSMVLTEIIPLFIWAVVLSIILGLFYHTFKNILSVALLHMVFNVCFLAPPKYNTIVILLSIMVCYAFRRYKKERQ